MRLQTIVLFLGLTILVALLFNLPSVLQRYLPLEWVVRPAPPGTQGARFAVWLTLQWLIPSLVVALFLRCARIGERVPRNFSLPLLAIGTAAFLAQLLLRFLASLFPGDGMLLAANIYLSHLVLPTKLILFVGAVWLLATLRSAPLAPERAPLVQQSR